MTATYDPSLGKTKDWVRFQIGDTDESAPMLQDEEIDAVLHGQANRYFAAAECLSIVSMKLSTAGGGLIEKTVDTVKLRWGIDAKASEAIRLRIAELRRLGAPRPRLFRAVEVRRTET